MTERKRIEKLLSLIHYVGKDTGVESKKKLHKLVFLLQHMGCDFGQSFTFHYYGPFSPTLAADLETASNEKVLVIEEPQELNWAYRIRVTSPTSEAAPLLQGPSEEIFAELSSKEPVFLEVLSTIVYLHDHFYRGKDIERRLHELKPDHKQHFKAALKFAREHFAVA